MTDPRQMLWPLTTFLLKHRLSGGSCRYVWQGLTPCMCGVSQRLPAQPPPETLGAVGVESIRAFRRAIAQRDYDDRLVYTFDYCFCLAGDPDHMYALVNAIEMDDRFCDGDWHWRPKRHRARLYQIRLPALASPSPPCLLRTLDDPPRLDPDRGTDSDDTSGASDNDDMDHNTCNVPDKTRASDEGKRRGKRKRSESIECKDESDDCIEDGERDGESNQETDTEWFMRQLTQGVVKKLSIPRRWSADLDACQKAALVLLFTETTTFESGL